MSEMDAFSFPPLNYSNSLFPLLTFPLRSKKYERNDNRRATWPSCLLRSPSFHFIDGSCLLLGCRKYTGVGGNKCPLAEGTAYASLPFVPLSLYFFLEEHMLNCSREGRRHHQQGVSCCAIDVKDIMYHRNILLSYLGYGTT